MPIKFRWPQDINAIRFGATLVWGVVNGIITTIQGTSPLSLVNAVAGRIKSLVQYGKCTTVDDEIYCNNGKLVAVDDELPAGYKRLLGITFDSNIRYETGEALTGDDDVTMTLDNLSSSGKNVFGSYNGANGKNFSLYIYGSASTGSYFRFGDQLKRPKYGTGKRTITFGKSGTSGFDSDSDVTPDEFTTPANVYIGMLPNSSSAAYAGDIIGSIIVSNRLEWIPCERESDGVIGYYEKYNGNFLEPVGSGLPVSLGYDTSHLSVEGTPEVLTIGTQTATVENLLAVDDIKDEQNIVSGTVTRRCEAVISDGTTPSGRYIGTVGEGNIIVKVRETGYEGDIATFDADRVAPLNGLSVNVEPIQSGSGDPSPDNVRPISGWTGCNIFHSQYNLFDQNIVTGASGWVRSEDEEFVDYKGAPVYKGTISNLYNKFRYYSSRIPVLKVQAGKRYVFRVWWRSVDAASSNGLKMRLWYDDQTYDDSSPMAANQTWKSITLVSNAAKTPAGIGFLYNNNYTIYLCGLMCMEYDQYMALGDDRTAFVCSNDRQSYTIQLGETVYGGTLDVTGGKMVVDRAMLDVTNSNWRMISVPQGTLFRTQQSIIWTKYNSTDVVCSKYPTVFSSSRQNKSLSCGTANVIDIIDSDYNSVTDFKTANANTQIVYPLATPLEITLTPTQISTLLGTNNIWSDAGSVKAYVADGDLVEHVTAQPMRTAEGSNTVSVTSAVDPVQLEVEYYKDK